ncbi:hypothetical protein LguiB_007855 [Lonicera macranthoides]
MAGQRFLYGGSGGDSNMTNILLQTQRVASCSSDPLFIPSSSPSPSPSFLGSRSMVSFEDVNRRYKSDNSFFCSFDREDNGDDELDEYFHQPDKKRRLKADQVQFLEKSFETENKLEPERKVQLAKDLGLQPRQVAIWFQNRRARWKNKQLERDYDVLQSSYNSLKADYENLLKDKDILKAEVLHLTDKLLLKEEDKKNWELSDTKSISESPQEHITDLVSDGEGTKDSVESKYEDLNSTKSYVFDSDSSYYTNGGRSSLLEPGDSSYVFEPDHSDLSQDEEDNLSKGLLPPLEYVFPKTEVADDYSDPPANSCYFGFPADDHSFGFWSY